METPEATSPQPHLPEAVLHSERRVRWVWLVPLAAVMAAVWIGYEAWSRRGVVVTVHLAQGHGLAPGADVRYSGISVGQVVAVDLSPDLEGVVVTASLVSQGKRLARAGARFWVVRPQLDVTGATGLETVVGPRYLAMLPGAGPPRRHFLGLSEPPLVERIEAGDLEIVLQSERRGGLRPGSPVLYRQVVIGTVLSVGLSSDAGAVQARVHIPKAYTQLIRTRSQFWDVGGFEAQLGLKGMSIEVDSVEALLGGGVAMATPPAGGEAVRTGHRFELQSKPKDEWFRWEPQIMLGSALLPPGSAMPAPLRAVLSWREGHWLKSARSRRGWVLQTDRGLIGPADLLEAPDAAAPDSVILEVAGRQLPLTGKPRWTAHGLTLLEVDVGTAKWPAARQRRTDSPEDCIAVADRATRPLPLAEVRLTPQERSWIIDPAVSVDEIWHGAVVLSREDGTMVGMVLVQSGSVRVALLGESDARQSEHP